jgi:predicted AAA+ superfamily ATPase
VEVSVQYIPRVFDIASKVKNKSCFLLGPRQTGKTTLIKNSIPNARYYNLLDSELYLALSRRPSLIREQSASDSRLVVIDEIQRMPQLLNEVHLLIEDLGLKFLLTGSSARKLRRGGVNLLGGRARIMYMHPFVQSELKDFDLLKALNFGLIPSIWFSDDPENDLRAYAGAYLQEEIAAEGATRNVPAFSRFLEVAALCNARILNYSNISNDAQVARTTVQEYFRILMDTYFASTISPWKKSRKRKAITTDKFYMFDTGLARYLRNQGAIAERSPAFGDAFETYIFHELKSYVDYRGIGEVGYWRSASGFEVDFILNDAVAIEVKGKNTVGDSDLRGLKAIQEEALLKEYLVVSTESIPRTVSGIRILPWQLFLEELWSGKYD